MLLTVQTSHKKYFSDAQLVLICIEHRWVVYVITDAMLIYVSKFYLTDLWFYWCVAGTIIYKMLEM